MKKAAHARNQLHISKSVWTGVFVCLFEQC